MLPYMTNPPNLIPHLILNSQAQILHHLWKAQTITLWYQQPPNHAMKMADWVQEMLVGTGFRVKKMWECGKKNKTTGELACACQTAQLSLTLHTLISETTKRTITYHLSMFSAAQMAKPKMKCGDPKSNFFWLGGSGPSLCVAVWVSKFPPDWFPK